MNKSKKIFILCKNNWYKSLYCKTKKKIFNYRKSISINDFLEIEKFFLNKNGLEIGGPSNFFNKEGPMPIYEKMGTLDNINFSSSTTWTGTINRENGFLIDGRKVGKQYIADATNLSFLKNYYYDFILSCNNIEHIANPIKAIEQWTSILNKKGTLVIVAPRKESNFDHNRAIVKFSHLISDYKNNMEEKDLTHLKEILRLHDLEMDPPAGTKEQFKERSLKNYENRCLHHHVFDLNILKDIYNYFNLSIIKTVQLDSDYIIIGQK